MKLYKDDIVKEITREKTIERLKRQGWTDEPEVAPTEDAPEEAPKRRGRPPRGE